MDLSYMKQLILSNEVVPISPTPRELRIPEDTRQMITIFGSRRTGKTWFLHQKAQEFREKGRKVAYLNMEDHRLHSLGDPNVIMDAVKDLWPQESLPVLMLDEIQAIPRWELFVRGVHERREAEIFLTGSSSRLLGPEIATQLRGRTLSYRMLPFSFTEYLRHRGISYDDRIAFSPDRRTVLSEFDRYLSWGGFPDAIDIVDDEPRIQLLQGYLDTIFYRDLVEHHGVRNIEALRSIHSYLLNVFASKVSLSKLHKKMIADGHSISRDSVYEYSAMFEEVGLLTSIRTTTDSVKARRLNPRKIYCLDNGLVSSINPSRGSIQGRLLEDTVMVHLVRLGREVTYFQGRNECDFIVSDRTRYIEAIQVTWSIDGDNRDREYGGLREAMDTLGISDGLILTHDTFDESWMGEGIRVIPVWYWLLYG